MTHARFSRTSAMAATCATLLTAALVTVALVAVPAHAAGEQDAKRHGTGLLVLDGDKVHFPAPEALRDRLGAFDLLTEAFPDDFGYAYVDGDTVVVDVVGEKGMALLDTMRQGRRLPSAPADPHSKAIAAVTAWQPGIAAATVRADVVEASRAATERLKHQVADIAYQDKVLAEAGIWRTEVQRPTGRVVARLQTLTDAIAARLVELYGTEKIAVVLEANPHKTEQVGRLDDGSPFYGGSRLTTPNGGGCTDAFSFHITATRPAMFTAGHCAPDGGNISTLREHLGYITPGSRENDSPSGTTMLPGDWMYRGDIALAEVASGKTSAGRIYRGVYNSTSSAAVRSMWSRRAQNGDGFCTGGSYGGEICGWTVSVPGADEYIGGKWKRNVVTSHVRQGWCTRGGDSGGPVYTVNSDGSVAAKGIHSSGGGGGSDHYGGALDPCSETFTDIWDAYLPFPGYIVVQ